MKLLIFGTGTFFKNRRKEFESCEIVGFVDNDINKQGYQLYGKDIFSPSEIENLKYDYVVTMGNSTNSISMKEQLFKMDVDFSKVIDFEQFIEKRDGIQRDKIVIFGTGAFFENRKRIFTEDIIAFIDNNIEKQGKVFYDRPIIGLIDIKRIKYDYIVIMTNPQNEKKIREQLCHEKIPEEKVFNFDEYKRKNNKSDFDIWDIHSYERYFFENTKQPGLVLNINEWNSDEIPLVSIITPYYNAGKYFEQTYNCVMNQTFPWFEWIIIDDGTDRKEDIRILDKFSKKDKRIKVIKQQNQGQSAARNRGFSKARAEIVVQLDADDLISPQYVEMTYWSLYFNKDADWAYTWGVGFQMSHYLWRKEWNAELLKTNNYLMVFSAVRKKAWEDIGGYKVEDFRYSEDWRFWLDMLSAGKKPVLLGGFHVWYRRTDNGALAESKSNAEIVKKNAEIIQNAAKTVKTDAIVKTYPLSEEKSFEKTEGIMWNEQAYSLSNRENTVNMLWIVPWMVMGGADKFNVDAAKGLSERGYNISVITTVKSENDWKYQYEKFTNEIFCLPDFLDKKDYLSFVEYYIRTRKINVLMVTNSTLGYYMLPYIRMRFPMLTIIDYVHMEEWYWRNGGHARTSGVLDDIIEKTFVCNSATREVLIDCFGVPENKVDTLHIGVDEEEFDNSKVEEGYLYSKLGVDRERPIVLFPCRIHPQKRPFMVLDIAEKVKEKIKNVVFAIVGDGPQLDELNWMIKQRRLDDTIICIGRSDNMKACYKDAKITLICSLKEGLALTAYESCAMGVPVISSDVGGQRDLVDKKVGDLIPTNDVEKDSLNKRTFDSSEINEYVDRIIELLTNTDEYDKCSITARTRIEDAFTINNMIDKLYSDINELMYNKASAKKRQELSEALSLVPSMTLEMYTLGVISE